MLIAKKVVKKRLSLKGPVSVIMHQNLTVLVVRFISRSRNEIVYSGTNIFCCLPGTMVYVL